MKQGSIANIETFGLVDGPGIRTVVFLNGCKLRCIFCHNPEMLKMQQNNYTSEELVKKILRNKPYFKRNNGGVTFSGGEPLLQYDFLVETCKLLKKENIHIALDTAGVGNGKYDEILDIVDLVIFDIKATEEELYNYITENHISESLKFLKKCQEKNKKMWLRQVIIPNINDNEGYINKLVEFIRPLKNIEKIEFLPYHTLGISKYKKLNIPYKLEGLQAMNEEKCKKLENELKEKLNT